MFLIIAFTLAVITFIISRNIIYNQRQNLKIYDKKYNKEILIDSKERFDIEEIKSILNNKKVRLELKYYDDLNNIFISNIVVDNYDVTYEKFIRGENFSEEEKESNKKIALISATLDNKGEEISFKYKEVLKGLKVNGVFNEINKTIILPSETFYNAIKTRKINDIYITSILSGETSDLLGAISDIEFYIKNKDKNAKINIFDYIKEDKEEEAKIYAEASFSIIFITILNSIGLTSLWISSRKRELAIRKAMGATNFKLMILYFKELFVLGILSVIFSLPLYLMIVKFTGGIIAGFDISFNLLVFLQSIISIFITAFLISVPSLIYLKRINPSNLLRGN